MKLKRTVSALMALSMVFAPLQVKYADIFILPLSVEAIAADYSSAEAFLGTADSLSNVTVYDGSTKEAAFSMNGRSYYQGLVFGNGGEVTYNVENVDKLSFTLGHVDNSSGYSVDFKVYLDEKEYDSFTLYRTMSLKEYEIDTSKADVVQIVVSSNHTGANSYALADFSVDSYSPSKTGTVPEYNSDTDFMSKGFNISDMKVYDGSTKEAAFNMNGRSYYQGLVFGNGGEVTYNVENVDKLSFTLGHVDNSSGYSVDFKVYLDEKEYDSFTLSNDMENTNYSIDTQKADVLQIVLSSNHTGANSYALGDVSIVISDDEGSVYGDCNNDGAFNVADVVLLQKWLLAVPDTHLENWKAADLCEDDRLDVFDLCLMKRNLVYTTKQSNG